MPQYRAAWLIGSYANMPAASVTLGGSVQAVGAGSRYLYHTNASLSLVGMMQNLLALAGVVNAIVVLTQSGHVKMTGVPFTVAWGTATLLRDLLGFTGDLAAAASHTAPNLSPLLWMPGKPETPLAQRLGTVGHRVHAVYSTTAPYSGKQESVVHGSRFFARYSFPMIDTERMVGATGEGGTWDTWWAQVAIRSARFYLYRDVLEDPGGTSSAISTLDDPLGPYVVSSPRSWKWDLSRGFERTDKRADLELSCHVIEDYA